MEKKAFLALCASVFSGKGFKKKGNSYYINLNNDIIAVFALQKSNYGEYYYINYGYCFASLNKYMPYPKDYQLNINCGRLLSSEGETLNYEQLDEQCFIEDLQRYICELVSTGEIGKGAILEKYIYHEPRNYAYIFDYKTLVYLGIEENGLSVHPDL